MAAADIRGGEPDPEGEAEPDPDGEGEPEADGDPGPDGDSDGDPKLDAEPVGDGDLDGGPGDPGDPDADGEGLGSGDGLGDGEWPGAGVGSGGDVAGGGGVGGQLGEVFSLQRTRTSTAPGQISTTADPLPLARTVTVSSPCWPAASVPDAALRASSGEEECADQITGPSAATRSICPEKPGASDREPGQTSSPSPPERQFPTPVILGGSSPRRPARRLRPEPPRWAGEVPACGGTANVGQPGKVPYPTAGCPSCGMLPLSFDPPATMAVATTTAPTQAQRPVWRRRR
jgi:hypothetical protein